MNVLSSLGLMVGVFLLVPKGLVVTAVLWAVSRVRPGPGVALFSVWVVVERWL